METPTHPLNVNITTPTSGDELPASTALWALGGFLLFTAVIFILVISSPW